MLKFAVCDDEKEVRDYLSSRIHDALAAEDLDGRVETFSGAQALVRLYEEEKAEFDLLFLDITMPGLDGLTAAKRIREKNKDVMLVFITASAEYVFSGYEVRAFRYILKPELVNGFAGVFRDCLKELTKADEVRFTFQSGAKTVSVPIKEIYYFESDKRKVNLYCGGRSYSFYGKLDEVETQLKKHDFVRCHQSFLINALKISSLGQNEVTLADGTVVPVSKHRAKETNEAFLWALR